MTDFGTPTAPLPKKLARGEKDRQAAANKSKPVSPEKDYPGNVYGCCSKPVKLK